MGWRGLPLQIDGSVGVCPFAGKAGECDDVLIVRDGWVTDTSFTNVVFEDAGVVFTRRRLVCLRGLGGRVCWTRGVIQACPIRVEDIRRFRRALLVNAAIGLGG